MGSGAPAARGPPGAAIEGISFVYSGACRLLRVGGGLGWRGLRRRRLGRGRWRNRRRRLGRCDGRWHLIHQDRRLRIRASIGPSSASGTSVGASRISAGSEAAWSVASSRKPHHELRRLLRAWRAEADAIAVGQHVIGPDLLAVHVRAGGAAEVGEQQATRGIEVETRMLGRDVAERERERAVGCRAEAAAPARGDRDRLAVLGTAGDRQRLGHGLGRESTTRPAGCQRSGRRPSLTGARARC